MLCLLKNLWKVKGYAAVIILLLVLQAYCDLSLPQYTSNIVDVGIQQGGIEDVVMEQISQDTYTGLTLLMEEGDQTYVDGWYTQSEDGTWKLSKEVDTEARTRLQEAFATPMMLLYGMEASGEVTMEQIAGMLSSGMVTREQLLAMQEEYMSGMEGLTDSMTEQVAVEFVKSEYTRQGMDLDAIQSAYLWKTGGKMMGLSLLMLAAAICGGLLSDRYETAQSGVWQGGFLFK